MDQLAVDYACQDEPVSGSSMPHTDGAPTATVTTTPESRAEILASEQKRSVVRFNDLSARQLRILASIVQEYCNRLYGLQLRLIETNGVSAGYLEYMQEVDEIFSVCSYEEYLKTDSENRAAWAKDTAAEAVAEQIGLSGT